jgi:hypothetical protein
MFWDKAVLIQWKLLLSWKNQLNSKLLSLFIIHLNKCLYIWTFIPFTYFLTK